MRRENIRRAAEREAIIREMTAQAQAARDLRDAGGGLEKWIGRVVKIGFEQSTDPNINKEWMWVEVTAVRGGRLVGVLQNTPVYATHVERGTECEFTEDEIYSLSTSRG